VNLRFYDMYLHGTKIGILVIFSEARGLYYLEA
jgi:hypothetical protein